MMTQIAPVARAAAPTLATLSFAAQRSDESLDLWPATPAESYAQASAEGQRRAAEFLALLRAEGCASGLLFRLAKDMGLPAPAGHDRGYLAGFLFAVEAELSRPR